MWFLLIAIPWCVGAVCIGIVAIRVVKIWMWGDV
jgi:hypothetical protein